MPIITADTKKRVESLRQTIASSRPDSPLAMNKAEVKWIEGQRSEDWFEDLASSRTNRKALEVPARAQPQQTISSHRWDFVRMSYLSETQA